MTERWAAAVVLGTILPLLSVAMSCGAGSATPGTSGPKSGARIATVTVSALSRGQGVPPRTREALEAAARLLEEDERRGTVLRVSRHRLGLEGETRLCVEVREDAAAGLVTKLEELSAGVDLLNVRREPCADNRPPIEAGDEGGR